MKLLGQKQLKREEEGEEEEGEEEGGGPLLCQTTCSNLRTRCCLERCVVV